MVIDLWDLEIPEMVQERKGKALSSGGGWRDGESGSRWNGQGEGEAQMKVTVLAPARGLSQDP